MKKYGVTLTGHYEKTISVYTASPEDAKRKLEIVLFDTDLIDFSDDDFISGKADIRDVATENCEDKETEDECMKYEDCTDCPCFCHICGECMCADED